MATTQQALLPDHVLGAVLALAEKQNEVTNQSCGVHKMTFTSCTGGIMHTATESSSRYLTLALSARSAMKALRPVAVGGPLTDGLGERLTRFLFDLPDEEHVSYLKHLENTGAAPSYEEVSTFEEIVKRFDAPTLGSAFRTLIKGDKSGDDQESAKQLIQFFGAIESQALSRYIASTQARAS